LPKQGDRAGAHCHSDPAVAGEEPLIIVIALQVLFSAD